MSSAQATPLNNIINNMSVLAQAKPVIISALPPSNGGGGGNYNLYSNYQNGPVKGGCENSDDMNSASRLAHTQSEGQLKRQEEFFSIKRSESSICAQHQSIGSKMSHIEDESLINKQNASNQMRQAAVMVALASQQSKQRLSATERLAMTAKRPQQNAQPLSSSRDSQSQQSKPASKEFGQSSPPPLPSHQNQQKHASVPASKPATNGQHKTMLAQTKPPVPPGAKPASMPTLETLLAVQRQLQRHTRQNLHSTNNKPQDLVKTSSQDANSGESNNKQGDIASAAKQEQSIGRDDHKEQQVSNDDRPFFSKQFPNLSRFPVNAKEQNNYVTSIHETYDKELPPLPVSISPSSYTNTTTSDESQMNSLESQSSPPTSLVSLPPPPPPISSYLQQYDEVTNHHQLSQQQQQQDQARKSNSSTPLTNCSSSSSSASSDVPSIRQFPVVPIKHQYHAASHSSPAPSVANERAQTQITTSQQQAAPKNVPLRPPPLAPRPDHLVAAAAMTAKVQPQAGSASKGQPATTSVQPGQDATLRSSAISELPKAFSGLRLGPSNPSVSFPPPPVSFAPQAQQPMPVPPVMQSRPQQQQHQQSATPGGGFDEPDCASLRFPTPPPPELLFDDGLGDEDEDDADLELASPKKKVVQFKPAGDEEDDEDFQCRIPTPPQKSMSFASFPDLNNCQPNFATQHLDHFFSANNPNSQQQRALFNSSSFSAVPIADELRKPAGNGNLGAPQPAPLLFHQAQQQQRPQHHQEQQAAANLCNKVAAPQLTVCVSDHDARLANSNGLLSTAGDHHRHYPTGDANHRRQLMMNAMVAAVASSSSPSSSSDGDGQSSNSSSSTSGVPSSIDSPSLKSETDFSYGAGLRAPATAVSSRSAMIGCASGPPASIMVMADLQNQHANTMKLMRRQQNVKNSFVHQSDPSTGRLQQQEQQQQQQQQQQQPQNHSHQSFEKFTGRPAQYLQQQLAASLGPRLQTSQRRNSSSSINSTSTVTSGNGSVTGATTTANKLNKLPRPALKQKKSVSFSDRVELVACAEEQCDSHLPNPLLARVLAAQNPSSVQLQQHQ